ncbi:hypothetical protein C7293_13350 [filamentous cyanobacterium CCT1]|nr:hypothetical protein C7293_13350 [filamentous cyanobacterium CCT1]PSN80310.1 hypothetical protein C8B47_07120 [filamentous cyanobacterium CCP4]
MQLNRDGGSPDQEPIRNERLRQARLAFNLSAFFVGTSAMLFMVGFLMLLAGKTSQGLLALLGSPASLSMRGYCMQLSSEANDRLDRMIYEASDEKKQIK